MIFIIRISSFILLFASSAISFAQEVFSQELGVQDASLRQMLRLSDGKILTTGSLNGTYMVKWSGSGDTMWTQLHPSIPGISCIELNDGRVLGVSYLGNYIFSSEGVLETQFGPMGHSAIQLADGMLLFTDLDSIRKTDLSGEQIWAVRMVKPLNPIYTVGTLLGTFDGGILTYSGFSGGGPFNNGKFLLIGRYDGSGNFLDSTRVYNNDCCGWIYPVEFRPLSDGGSLGISSTGTGSSTIVRISSVGEVNWTESFGMLNGTDPFISPHGISHTDADRIVVSGISDPQIDDLGNISHAIRIAEFDGSGGFICTEDLRWNYENEINEVTVQIISGAATAEHHILYHSVSENTLIGYNEFCLSTLIKEPDTAFDIWTFPGHLQLLIRDESITRWALHDMSSRQLADGRVSSIPVLIPTSGLASGTYMVVLVGKNGYRVAKQCVIMN